MCQVMSKPSRPAVNSIRSANSLSCFKNSRNPGRSKTVTWLILGFPSHSFKPQHIKIKTTHLENRFDKQLITIKCNRTPCRKISTPSQTTSIQLLLLDYEA